MWGICDHALAGASWRAEVACSLLAGAHPGPVNARVSTHSPCLPFALCPGCVGLGLYLILVGSIKMQWCLPGQLSNGHKTELVGNNEINNRFWQQWSVQPLRWLSKSSFSSASCGQPAWNILQRPGCHDKPLWPSIFKVWFSRTSWSVLKINYYQEQVKWYLGKIFSNTNGRCGGVAR